MGFVEVPVKVLSVDNGRREAVLQMLVDTGAMFTVAPKRILTELGVRARDSRVFETIDGKPMQRQVGVIDIEVEGRRPPGPVPVVFGEADDGVVLGVTALEAIGLKVNPVEGKLEPMPLRLWAHGNRGVT